LKKSSSAIVRLASNSSGFTDSTYSTQEKVDPKISLDVVAKKEILPLPEIKFL
jgi:uncharacterized LabA/DUF88 family protein